MTEATIKSVFDAATCVAGLTKTERITILYVESVCVDLKGQMDARRMNADDVEVLNRWDVVLWTYVPSQNVVALTPDGWAVAGLLRRARAERNSLLQAATAVEAVTA